MSRFAKFGRLGGESTSAKKCRSSKRNGAKGGRPRNPKIERIMRVRGVSRSRAYQLLKETK